MKHGLTVRGDSLYCPLAFSLDAYWSCNTDCHHCYFRNMNHVWGNELRPTNPETLRKKLESGSKNKKPKTPLAHCIKNKKTIRIGNKSDPFQDIELKMGVSKDCIKVLNKLEWSYVIQTRFTRNLINTCFNDLLEAESNATVMPIISPGLEKDWEIFERKRTTSIPDRIEDIKKLIKNNIPVGVNGEPFIPGFHTIKDFMDTIKLMKSIGIKSYNTYNFHFTPFVAKRIHGLPGVDIEKIWEMNQDKPWKKILKKLLTIADNYDIVLGCPDFVNTGSLHREQANTCCGINVPYPTTYNTHNFKILAQKGMDFRNIVRCTYDGSADLKQGMDIIRGRRADFYTLRDAGCEVNE